MAAPECTPAKRLQDALAPLLPKGVTLVVSQYWEEEVELENLAARPKRRGKGSEAMRHLVRLADEQDVNLMLCVAGKPGSKKYGRLVEFYRRFGFEVGAQEETMRRPAGMTH